MISGYLDDDGGEFVTINFTGWGGLEQCAVHSKVRDNFIRLNFPITLPRNGRWIEFRLAIDELEFFEDEFFVRLDNIKVIQKNLAKWALLCSRNCAKKNELQYLISLSFMKDNSSVMVNLEVVTHLNLELRPLEPQSEMHRCSDKRPYIVDL